MLELRLVMVDELGDEWGVRTYRLPDGLDELALDLWKSAKEEEAREEYPEAQGFYFENLTEWNAMINESIWEWR